MPQLQPFRKYVSLAVAAPYAGCSQKFLRRRIAAGDLESYLVGGRRFTTLAHVDLMMARHKNRRARKGRGIRGNAPVVARNTKEGAA